MEYVYTLNLQAQARTVDDLLRTLDEVKKEVAAGNAMAHDRDDNRRYALSIDKEEPNKDGPET